MSSSFPILGSTSHPHESFSAARELEARLSRVVRGEVRFDAGSRALYAADASNYRQVPIGVVVPRDAADVEATLAACRELGAPILSRGAGTSLAGQCCNVAVVLDFSKYMRNIVSLDATMRSAVVEPGIVLDRVREAAEWHHLTFAPDPATHSRCTLGGMIGNNSCGTHALMGGKTVDNIHSLDVLLYDGTRLTVGPTSDEEFHRIVRGGGRAAEIYRGLDRIRRQYAQLVRDRFPDIPRRVSGYNLDELLPERGFHVARALVGSEGTCVTVLHATLDLKHSPPCRRLVVAAFDDAFIAADHVPFVLEFKPIGLEGIDDVLTSFMLRKGLAVEDVKLLPPGRGFLLVEFGADTEAEVLTQAEAFVAAARSLPSRPAVELYSVADAARIWAVRESALGATVFVPGEPHGWEGWEDAAVPPEKLGSYLRQLFALMKEYGYRSPMYGHFGQGCVHLRINFDLESQEGVRNFREFLDRATDIVIAHGGSISGEHGDGQARAALLPKMFGPELMQAFREFKALWDPENRMNPGKLVDPIAVYEPTENLRVGPKTDQDRKPNPAAKDTTFFRFPDDGGSLAEATLRCVGVGACRKESHGTMCPSYMATREEQHSTRGRAHLLWEMLEGDVLPGGPSGGWTSEPVKEALDLCLACKACKTECPVNVDIATYKAEFLAHYYRKHRHPLRDYAFGFMDRWASMAHAIPGLTPRLANLPLQIPGVSHAIKAALHIAPQRSLPQFAARSFQAGRAWRVPQFSHLRRGSEAVLLWPDTWNNYYHPHALDSAESVLASAGFEVEVPAGHVCCGRPLYDFGFLDQARAYLERTMAKLAPQIDAGLPIVFLEPSCASVFRDELRNFFPHDLRAGRLREQTWLLADFLVQRAPGYQPPDLTGRTLLLHGHCHHKSGSASAKKMTAETELLRRTGANVTLLDSGCCGMAGPFGFEKEKYEVSQTLGERVLLPAFRNAAPETILVSDGFSCREQVAQNLTRHAQHLAEVLDSGRGVKP
ncbi:FAD-binding and (Fe-S)-binding domain-containing protein [Silvibacterium dinghuense]|uniref:FAD-binding oxidoreductase n=1 Tax=Silvibacterium dinghuense TaxID=1560006 RepID=A0A4Q1SHI9_9BACT|nr:FAD-binding and (Fe-S)-binding domain-containing protein [Silvibacterium dinghuense]RXS97048.1 FAD-binding oxidoreductase [Silvibacterium dinghuense]GGG95759.1 dimethylmenaquinone methyltransferase [Silvibacterium dinghuense]